MEIWESLFFCFIRSCIVVYLPLSKKFITVSVGFYGCFLHPSVYIPLSSNILRLFHPTTLCKHLYIISHGCWLRSLRPHGSVGGLSWQNRIGSWQASSSPSFDSPRVRTLAPVYLVYSTPPGIYTWNSQYNVFHLVFVNTKYSVS